MNVSSLSSVLKSDLLYSVSSNKNFHPNNNTVAPLGKKVDTVSISQEAKDLFATLNSTSQEYTWDDSAPWESKKQHLGQSYPHLDLNEAVTQRILTDGNFNFSMSLPDKNGNDMYIFPEEWSEENKELYLKFEKEEKAAYEQYLASNRSPDSVEKVNNATTKLMIVATHGHTHKLTEESVNEATDVYEKTLTKHLQDTGRVSGDEKPLTGLILSQSLDEDEVAEELEKMKEEFTKQIASAPTTKHDVQSDNNISSSSENKTEKTNIPYYLNMLHQNQNNE